MKNWKKKNKFMESKRKYYYNYDFYNMKSDEQLTILSNFKTRQATLDYSCGPNAILMILNYFNDYTLSEKNIFDDVKCKQPGGTKIENIVTFFRQNNGSITNLVGFRVSDIRNSRNIE